MEEVTGSSPVGTTKHFKVKGLCLEVNVQNTKILIVDDDIDFVHLVSEYFRTRGCIIKHALDLEEAREHIETFNPQLILLDRVLGREDGFILIPEIRQNSIVRNTAIIAVTGTAFPQDKLSAFQSGVDDIVDKPFDIRELEARAQAALRRSASYVPATQILKYLNLELDIRTNEARVESKLLPLTQTEFRLLSLLLSHRGNVVDRKQLEWKCLSARNTGAKTLDVHMTSLRKKLKRFRGAIRTIRGRGFLIEENKKNAG